MKNTLNMIAVALIAGAGIVCAADDDAKKGDKPAKGAVKGLMAADKDKDGNVSLDEFKAWGAARPKPMEAEKAEALFKKRDTNGDGSITKDELAAAAPKKKGGDDAKKPGKKKKDGAQ